MNRMMNQTAQIRIKVAMMEAKMVRADILFSPWKMEIGERWNIAPRFRDWFNWINLED